MQTVNSLVGSQQKNKRLQQLPFKDFMTGENFEHRRSLYLRKMKNGEIAECSSFNKLILIAAGDPNRKQTVAARNCLMKRLLKMSK